MTSRRLPRLLRRLAPLALTVLLAACAGNKALEESRRSFATQSPDVALIDLRSRVEADPRRVRRVRVRGGPAPEAADAAAHGVAQDIGAS